MFFVPPACFKPQRLCLADPALLAFSRRYEPVFRVVTLDGEAVWRRRRYRCRRAAVPGTFHFSVLDNGVTSNEFW